MEGTRTTFQQKFGQELEQKEDFKRWITPEPPYTNDPNRKYRGPVAMYYQTKNGDLRFFWVGTTRLLREIN
jgi:hypothetical protein